MADKEKIQDVHTLRGEAYEEWQDWLREAEDDYKVHLGDQWDAATAAKLRKQNRPVLSLNTTKNHVDLITGYEKQNRSDVRIYPVEDSDQELADLYTEIIKWLMVERGNEYAVSQAFENAAICGLGWIHPRVVYDEDFIDGDIILDSESPFRIMADPDFTKLDLSDCGYIFRHAYLSKHAAGSLYPEFAKELKKLGGGSVDQFYIQKPSGKSKSHISIIEKWYREHEKQTLIINMSTRKVDIFDGTKKELARIKKIIKMVQDTAEVHPDYEDFRYLEIIERRLPRIKLLTVAENDLVLYDDYHPQGVNKYPFIPIVGTYIPAFNDWTWKLQGIVRSLKDSQKEKNKRRSQILGSVLKLTWSGYFYKAGSVKNPKDLEQSGEGKNIEVQDGYDFPQRIEMPEMPAALIKLEELHGADMKEIGLNPDLLGLMQEASPAGITLQLRQKQGLVRVQNIFDNLSFAKKQLGKYLIELVNTFSADKIQRITGKPIPMNFEEIKESSRFDTIVDENVNSPTYRMANFMTVMQMIEAGFPISPDVAVKMSELPKEYKELIIKGMAQFAQNAGGGGAPPGEIPQGMPPA
jgi:hypothetical protein